MKRYFFIILILLCCFTNAQTKYWVEISKEIKVDTFLENHGLSNSAVVVSQWLNSFSTYLSNEELDKYNDYPFVDTLYKVKELVSLSPSSLHLFDTEMLAVNYDRMDLGAFGERNLSGKGVKIGVIDAGFAQSDTIQELQHLFTSSSDVVDRNFVQDSLTVFNPYSRFDNHGTKVLSLLAGKTDTISALAPDAHYFLAKTENNLREERLEEDHWVEALEWMHSQGVRLVNSSLGYSTYFTDSLENYVPEQMNGKTSVVARAATIAVRDKNMIVVVAGGNMGNDDWLVLTTPADADGIIAVGAIEKVGYKKKKYSSIGGDLPYVKPDFVCYSPNGTSYTSPVICSMIACMLELNPNLSSREIYSLLRKASNLSDVPNNYLGYGMPSATKILALMGGKKDFNPPNVVKCRKIKCRIPMLVSEDSAIIYHKSDARNVVKVEIFNRDEGVNSLEILRDVLIKRSTVIFPNGKVVEIFWR